MVCFSTLPSAEIAIISLLSEIQFPAYFISWLKAKFEIVRNSSTNFLKIITGNGLGYRQLAEKGTRVCRLSIGLLVKLIIFFLTVPLIGDEPLLATGV